jgi:hypothetical protein
MPEGRGMSRFAGYRQKQSTLTARVLGGPTPIPSPDSFDSVPIKGFFLAEMRRVLAHNRSLPDFSAMSPDAIRDHFLRQAGR